jgi:hypothetical protein
VTPRLRKHGVGTPHVGRSQPNAPPAAATQRKDPSDPTAGQAGGHARRRSTPIASLFLIIFSYIKKIPAPQRKPWMVVKLGKRWYF